jgi:hypothetical protein
MLSLAAELNPAQTCGTREAMPATVRVFENMMKEYRVKVVTEEMTVIPEKECLEEND